LEQEQLLVDHLVPHTFFHVHSTGYDHYRHILEIAGLAGIQLTVEANGPSLGDLVPVMEEILGQTRLIVFVDAYFEELVEVVRKLPRNGLYVMVSDKFIDSDVAFKELVRSSWG
jgi:thymidylate kinase